MIESILKNKMLLKSDIVGIYLFSNQGPLYYNTLIYGPDITDKVIANNAKTVFHNLNEKKIVPGYLLKSTEPNDSAYYFGFVRPFYDFDSDTLLGMKLSY